MITDELESREPNKFFDDIYPSGLRIYGRMEPHSAKCRKCGNYLIDREEIYCNDCK